jgi:transposase
LVRIPAYSPELNPSEKIWAYIKQYYKNRVFENLENVKLWLHTFVKENLSDKIVKSITHNHFFLNDFYSVF